MSLICPPVRQTGVPSVPALLFAVRLSGATIARLSHACAQRFAGFTETVQALIAVAAVKHLDETGFRIAGKTQWLPIACTKLLTAYRIAAHGSMLEGLAGIVVHDHWKPYYTLSGVLRRRACHLISRARERGKPLEPALLGLINRRYDAIVAAGSAMASARTSAISRHSRASSAASSAGGIRSRSGEISSSSLAICRATRTTLSDPAQDIAARARASGRTKVLTPD